MAEDDGFLSRWSRRKVRAKQGVPAVAPEGDGGVARADTVQPRADAAVPVAPRVVAPRPAVPTAGAAPRQPSANPRCPVPPAPRRRQRWTTWPH